MDPRYLRLKALLEERFGLDAPELGISRLQRTAKLRAFLDGELPRAIARELEGLSAHDRAAFEEAIYDHLLRFFLRSEAASGFLCALPSKGEAVRLRWANEDQYYVHASLPQAKDRKSSDSFVHEDLRGFLKRELESFLASEASRLVDEVDAGLDGALAQLRIVRSIASEIIDRFAAIENLRKQIWLRKKFVTEASYCIRLGLVPESFHPEIAANQAQQEEWAELGFPEAGSLADHPTRMVDTRHFSAEFTARLLEALGDLDEKTDGILFHSENFQALSLMEARYRNRIDCIYIDPPYNTSNDGFVYKDSYPHASWLTMMRDRLTKAENLLHDSACLFVSIDSNERDRLGLLADQCLQLDRLNTFIWVNNLKGRQIAGRGAAGTHEYIFAFGREGCGPFSVPVEWATKLMPSTYKGFSYEVLKDEHGPYVLKNELYNTNAKFNEETRPNLVFNIHYEPRSGEIRFSSIEEAIDFDGFVKIPPHRNKNGTHRYHAWRWSREKILNESHNLAFISNGNRYRVFTKVRDFEQTHLKDLITDISTSMGTRCLSDLFGRAPTVEYPKPIELVQLLVRQSDEAGTVLDFFAGSGSTGHAVVALNREEKSRRKFLLVEMGDHFDTVLLPRLKKVAFSPAWKGGKPSRFATEEEAEYGPRLLKVVRLESYEDALFNLELGRSHSPPDFVDPTSYRLRTRQPGAKEDREVSVDLVETFNWLIGLKVDRITAPQRFHLELGRDTEGRLRPDPEGPHWFRSVAGELPDGKRALVIWRNCRGDAEGDERALHAWFRGHADAERETPFDLVYVNGECDLETLKKAHEAWEVRRIEAEFHRRMFDLEASEPLSRSGDEGAGEPRCR